MSLIAAAKLSRHVGVGRSYALMLDYDSQRGVFMAIVLSLDRNLQEKFS